MLSAHDEQGRDLLLYLNNRLQQHQGKVRADQMSADDVTLAKQWHARGFIEFRALGIDDVDFTQSNPATHIVGFSDAATELARQFAAA